MDCFTDRPITENVVKRGLKMPPYTKGLVFAQDLNSEIKRLEPADLTFMTKKAAEEHALKLCRAWIDGQEAKSASGKDVSDPQSEV
jgi:hypothetical protein